MDKYILTHSAHFTDPESQYLDTEDGTVGGIFDTEEQAHAGMMELLQTPYYRYYADKARITHYSEGYMAEINDPAMHAVLRTYCHDFSRPSVDKLVMR